MISIKLLSNYYHIYHITLYYYIYIYISHYITNIYYCNPIHTNSIGTRLVRTDKVVALPLDHLAEICGRDAMMITYGSVGFMTFYDIL